MGKMKSTGIHNMWIIFSSSNQVINGDLKIYIFWKRSKMKTENQAFQRC